MWSKPTSLYTREEKKKVLKKVIELSTVTAFHHHFYKWEGKLFRQKEGAGIGLRGAGSLARHAVGEFADLFTQILKEQGIDILLLTIYVDDLLLISKNLRIGSRWMDGKLHWSKETELEDLEKGRDNEEVTLQVYLDAANEIIECLKFTG